MRNPEIYDLDSWADFRSVIAEIRKKYGTHTYGENDNPLVRKNDIVFRGQSDSDWKLETTLERTSDKPFSILEYVEHATSCSNEIESISGKNWEIPLFPAIEKEMKDNQTSTRPYLPCYEYLVYLRHLEFPSPLLDWTRSPYVAAFFALEQPNTAEKFCVFASIDCPNVGKNSCAGDASISSKGPYVTTHIRHFAQKASYTFATRWNRDEDRHLFCSHYEVEPYPDNEQDILVKITIPRSDRIFALKELEDYNINRYTLFQSEDSLVRSLGLREFELGGIWGNK